MSLTVLVGGAAEAAQTVTLAWNPSASANVGGYHIHYGTNGANFQNFLDAGANNACEVGGLQAGQTITFAVSAYNSKGMEGPASSPISYVVPETARVTMNIGYGAIGLQAGLANAVGSAVEVATPDLIPATVPVAATNTAGASLGNGAIIGFTVTPGATYQVQASVDLTTWTTIWQTTATSNTWSQFQDVESANLNARFYRVVCQ